VAAFCFAADYRFMGILLIFVLYRSRDASLPAQFFLAGFVMFFGIWGANCLRYAESYTPVYLLRFSLREMYGLFAFALIPFYNRERGRQLPKPFYYGFYPVHLLILYGIARVIGVM
ncbi:MAG: conjugal transfer protein TraX, partial [Lachnospiraceae bacterium]|nr:conjugal transfer protein TraX [Lachnospiraceae bacterium]